MTRKEELLSLKGKYAFAVYADESKKTVNLFLVYSDISDITHDVCLFHKTDSENNVCYFECVSKYDIQSDSFIEMTENKKTNTYFTISDRIIKSFKKLDNAEKDIKKTIKKRKGENWYTDFYILRKISAEYIIDLYKNTPSPKDSELRFELNEEYVDSLLNRLDAFMQNNKHDRFN